MRKISVLGVKNHRSAAVRGGGGRRRVRPPPLDSLVRPILFLCRPYCILFWCSSTTIEQYYEFRYKKGMFHALTYLFYVYIYLLSYSTRICVGSINLWCSVLTFIIDLCMVVRPKKVNEKKTTVLSTYCAYFLDVSGNKQRFLPNDRFVGLCKQNAGTWENSRIFYKKGIFSDFDSVCILWYLF